MTGPGVCLVKVSLWLGQLGHSLDRGKSLFEKKKDRHILEKDGKYLCALFKRMVTQGHLFRAPGIAKQIERKERGKSEEEKKKKVPRHYCLPYIKGVIEQIKRVLAPLDLRTVNRTEKWHWSLSRRIKDSIPVEWQIEVKHFFARIVATNTSVRPFARSKQGWPNIKDIKDTRRTNVLTNRLWQSMRPSTSITLIGKTWKSFKMNSSCITGRLKKRSYTSDEQGCRSGVECCMEEIVLVVVAK